MKQEKFELEKGFTALRDERKTDIKILGNLLAWGIMIFGMWYLLSSVLISVLVK